ncbi:hypothetical protein [Mycobacterium numidiamassiliense]|uniref:hypothetical protein n=1 Tax=Mycobacterium numidiamassiliense TaxID=1841861 RepID=UPI00097D08C6|nr:hypothetical protein [Mycobacterium numidiamassiliense]
MAPTTTSAGGSTGCGVGRGRRGRFTVGIGIGIGGLRCFLGVRMFAPSSTTSHPQGDGDESG